MKWAFANQPKNRNKSASDHQGFTLIEVLIAMAIFAVGILAVGSMQISSFKNGDSARMRTDATIIAAGLAEEIMSTTYNQVLAIPSTPTSSGRFTYERQVTPNVPMDSTCTVEIDVCWRDKAGAPADCATSAAGKKNVHLEFVRANL